MKQLLQTLFFFLLVTQICFAQWYQQNSGTTKNLHDVVFLNAYTGIAVGDSGLILRSTNDGLNWVMQPSGTSNNLNDVFFNNSNTGYAVGDSGTIIKTTNWGLSWVEQSSGTFATLKSVCFIDENNGWVCGAEYNTWPYQCELIKTTNGGTNWISQPKDSFPNWDLRSIDFINENIGWIIQGTYGGSGNSMRMRIHKTTDGGLTWDLKLLVYGDITPIALNKLKFINQDYGIVVGGGWRPERRIYKTTDSGETWDEQVFPTRGEFWDLSFMDQNYCTIVGDSGQIYYTTDFGENWVQQYTGTNISFKGVYFVNELIGWVVGDNGTILHTTNGGVSFVEEEQIDEIPTIYFLSNNFPNPFNPSTKIKYSIPPVGTQRAVSVQIKVFDVLGNEIETLANEEKTIGTYELTWNAANLPSGVYFYQLRAGSFVETRKMLLLK